MDAQMKPPPDRVGAPFVFSGYELEELFDKRGRFRLRALRKRQEEKALQILLVGYHGIMVDGLEEVYQHVTPVSFSLVKARRTHWGYYYMTLVYRYQGTTWRHVFRFERSVNGGLSGRLYFNSRRRIATK